MDRRELLLDWIVNREEARKAKMVGLPKPWTKDEIIQRTRFCNVRRMDDKVSRWLLDHWYVKGVSKRQILVNVGMARLINWPDSLAVMAEAGLNKHFHGERAKVAMNVIKGHGKLFTGVYIINGIAGQDKVTTVSNQFIDLFENGAKLVDDTSMERTHANLQQLLGFGSFIAGQMVADMRWVWPGTWNDKNTWAPLGPGSRRGIAWIGGWNGSDDLPSLRQSDFLDQLRRLTHWLMAQPRFQLVHADRKLELHDIQNVLCEFDKWMRLHTGTGKARNGYAGQA